MRLVTLEMAKAHLRLGTADLPEDTESDLRAKIDQAEALVLDYVDQRLDEASAWSAEVASWNAEDSGSPTYTVPPQVQAAVLIMLTELWRFRGDDIDDDEPRRGMGELHPKAVAYLYRFRDPALA